MNLNESLEFGLLEGKKDFKGAIFFLEKIIFDCYFPKSVWEVGHIDCHPKASLCELGMSLKNRLFS